MKNKIFTLILTLILIVTPAFAADNILNSVLLEGTGNSYNIYLRTDKVTNVKKSIQADGSLLIDLKNTTIAENVNTKYMNTPDVNSIVIENAGGNEVKILVKAKNIENVDIIFDTPASSPVVVKDRVSNKTIGWSVFAFLMICVVLGSLRKTEEEEDFTAMKKDLAEREIKMYKEYKMEILNSAKIDYKLKQQYLKRNGIQHADTIRTLQKTSCR